MSTQDGFLSKDKRVVKLPHPLRLKEEVIRHKLGVLLSFYTILEMALASFEKANDIQKKDILSDLIKIALANDVITEKEMQEKLLVEQSTVNRWKNGETLPPKRKQVAILALVSENVGVEKKSLELQLENIRREIENEEAAARQGGH